ncbi:MULTISPECIES: hypothetical protein [unclassified Polaromonas]|uniref:hypothetical protein n=1 Tax=unclassified Polaromonas TaxID=2638319 RepID=UPI0018CB4A3F|nr:MULTISPECIES: hypothetical protein [unclassified Polaromonas]MBG6073609.1 hypothetical protein [Polaromonas sp. CG_9.7]MBG6115612.1 hypothetical protein [Polaromonas sp. CG_9.2]MDH6185065.1 hypothetical protein [Polaromonas sp. CG_23.6]
MTRFHVPSTNVPTLTDIVHPEVVPSTLSGTTNDESAEAKIAAATNLQALMVQRVVGHASGVLEKRLPEFTEQLIRAHVQVLMPLLIVEIERVVRESVSQAFEQEVAVSHGQKET